jgi:predicted ATPase
MTTISTNQGFPYWSAVGTALGGWALFEQEQSEEGIRQIQQGLAAFRDTGAEVWRPYWLALLAEAYWHAGRTEEGLVLLAEALAFVHKNGERFWEAEVYRLKGDLLLALAPDNHPEVETCFHQAIDITRHQQAKSLELRAATSLARLWWNQGKRAEARDLLAGVYSWFTEGFDTADLQEAKALLDELA